MFMMKFMVCKDRCIAKSTVCYESKIGLSNPGAAGTCFESSCKVEIEWKNEEITFGRALFKLFTGCITSVMNYDIAKVISSDESPNIESCMPKIVGADKMVKLFVNIEDGCSVIVTNAKIHAPPNTTTSTTKMPPPTQSSQKGSAEASPFPDWGYAVIGIVILVVILFIGFVVYYLYRKRRTSKRIPPNVDRKQPKTTKAKDATVETLTKKDNDLEAAKSVPQKSQKEGKKAKTIKPTP
uniref:Uncharacterized protein n=1 Tax=Panagrolaimus sp. PS1159 TaxID=55785 RepID=A0AC35FNL8_9BILA